MQLITHLVLFSRKSNFSCSSVYITNDHLFNMFSCFIAEENWRRGDQRSVLADYATVCFRRYYICKKKIPKHPKCLSILQISALSPSWFHLFATELVDNGWQWLAVVDNSWQWLAMVGNGKPLCFRACWQSRRAEKYSPPAPAYSSSETPANWQLKFHLH